MKPLFACLVLAGLTLVACAQAPSNTAADGNVVAGFGADEATGYATGARAGPPPGRTEADRAARRAYYQGPRANEWF